MAFAYMYMKKDEKCKEGFQDGGPNGGPEIAGCKQVCFARHPDAARMYNDGDNDVAMTTIDKCVAHCQAVQGRTQGGCSSCG
ncbi:MAG TPA: hypothetical protein PKD85_00570 [Saprospiraceae bacterium]|nr:hypothetical protein [Saprospiraceae bacterium]